MILERGVPQGFLDDAGIAGQQRLVRRWLPASVSPDPLLVPDRPWEGRSLNLYGSVLPDPTGGYRMYYSCFRPPNPHSLLLYATSRDGFTWEKSELGLVEHDGSRANNILIAPERSPHSPCVLWDPQDTEWPWKLLGFWNDAVPPAWNERWGLYVWRSRDGLRWEELPGAARARLGDRCSAYRDGRTGRYAFLSRDPDQFACVGGRHIARSESEDFRTWSRPELILAPDLDDEPDVEFYGMPVFQRNGWYFGLLEYWDSARDVIEVHLAVSRDGTAWQRPLPRRPFLAATYDWNRAWTTCANNGPVILNEQMAFYFGGRWVAHNWDSVRHHGVIGVASLPLDRFCALEGGAGGTLTTVALEWPGGDLLVNADTRDSFESHPGHCTGELGVEVLDAAGAPLPDWSGERKAVFRGNTHCRGAIHNRRVVWPGDRSLAALAGRTIQLRFHLRHTRLFTFEAGSQ
jgi:hypothetical protein